MMQWSYDATMIQDVAQEWSQMPPARKKVAAQKAAPYLHVRVDPDQMRRIKQLALDEECNLTELVLRGLSMLFKSRKLPPLDTPNRNER
jgi:hypothetical protein